MPESALSEAQAEAAIAAAGNVPSEGTGRVREALRTAFVGARPEGALARHMRDVSEQRGDQWETTLQSLRGAFRKLNPKSDKKRTAGIVMAGNRHARLEYEGRGGLHGLRRAGRILRGLAMPGSLPPLDTTPLGTSPERSLTVGDHGKPLPQRPYIGAGYDPDGNVDPVFLAYAYGKELAGGRNRFDRKAVQKGVARWIRHCHGQAAAGEGPAATRALYDHMAAKGKAASLLSDSLLIASGAWDGATQAAEQEDFALADLVAFLDGRHFRGER